MNKIGKKLAKYGWIDVALRDDSKLMILICESHDQARLFLDFLNGRLYRFVVKRKLVGFEISLFIRAYSASTLAVQPGHRSFLFAEDVLAEKVCYITTGYLINGQHFAYSKERLPFPYSYSKVASHEPISSNLIYSKANDRPPSRTGSIANVGKLAPGLNWIRRCLSKLWS